MQIKCVKDDVFQSRADLIVIGMYENEDIRNPFLLKADDLLTGRLNRLINVKDFKGTLGESLLFSSSAEIFSEYFLVVGLGKPDVLSYSKLQEAAGLAVQTAKKLGLSSIAMEFFGEDADNFRADETAEAIASACGIANYSFDTYKEKKPQKTITNVIIVGENIRDVRQAQKGIERAQIIVDGVSIARDLVNTPAKDMTPSHLAQAAQEVAQKSQGIIRIKLYDRKECLKKEMNAFLAVSQGSIEPPVFIHLSYKPSGRSKKLVALVGKGVTFDSGGLSLKLGNYMETMKCDMAGAAAVIGTFATLARLKPSLEIHGFIAATENMPSGNAIRPGDVVRASNKTTIEIANTDAEGRLTLADALTQAQKLKPDFVIDLATLTGACMVALGEEISGIMSNRPELAQSLLKSAQESGEQMWELPLFSNYDKLIKSEVADVKNISTVNYGGALTAGLFLQRFIKENQPWAHIDIAGPAFAEREFGSYISKGATGYGVRTLIKWLGSM